jgi:hypothetical protein
METIRNTTAYLANLSKAVIASIYTILFPLQVLPMLTAIAHCSTYGTLVTACVISSIAMVAQTLLFNDPKLRPCRAAMLTLNILAMSQMVMLS